MADVDVVGLEQLQDGLRSAVVELDQLGDAHAQAGRLLVDAAAAAAPRDTGRLADGHESVIVAGAVRVVNPVPYAVFVHAGRPWLSDTLDRLEPDLLAVYEADVQRILNNI